MPKKLTHKEVKDYIKSFEGYKLLSNEYKNSQTKLEIQCPEGHIFERAYAQFQLNQRCSGCATNKKHTYKEVKNYVESFEGYKLLSEEYKNSLTKLEIQCPEGHKC